MNKEPDAECWTLYTDASSCPNTKQAAIGFVIYKPLVNESLTQVGKSIEYVTSHSAELTAVIQGLKEAYRRGARVIEVRSDAQNMVNQLNGICNVNAGQTKALHAQAKQQIGRFTAATVVYVARTENSVADKLAKSALKSSAAPAPAVKAAADPPAPVKSKAEPVPVAKSVSDPAPAPKLPQQFWKPVGNELCVWNLEKLWALAKNFPLETVAVSDLHPFLDAPGWFGDEPLTLRRIAELSYQTTNADLEMPLLLCDAELLDGRFRLAKALSTGRQEVKLKRLKHLPKPDARYPLRYAP